MYAHSNMIHECSVEKGRGEGISKEGGISLKKKEHYKPTGATAERHFLLSPQKEFFKKGDSVTNLFSVFRILSRIKENSFL